MRLKVLVASLALGVFAESVSAQRPANAVPIVQGSRVRVKAPSLVAPLIANFLEQRGDTLVFIEDSDGRGIWSFAISTIERLETTAGETARSQRQIGKGALIGGGAGLVAGLGVAVFASPSDSTREYNKPAMTAIGAAVGAGIGALIGARTRTERWVNVPLPRRFSFAPNGRGGFSIAIGVR